MAWVQTVDQKVATSPVGRWFRLEGCGHPKARRKSYFLTEMRAGLATFFAMAYIMAVNASIVADTGGTCVCNRTKGDPYCKQDNEYLLCAQAIKRDIVTATAVMSCLSSVCMGLFANLQVPVSLAPGMGLNAYFAYTVVGRAGSGPVPYQVALTAIFVEGFIFLGLAILGMRQWLARILPQSIKLATGVGIGLFLTIIGLTYNGGISLIVGSQATPTELAGCSRENFDLLTGTCPSWDKMRRPALWLAIFCGGFLPALLTIYRVKGAIILGIILVSIISWPRNTSVTVFPNDPVGDDAYNFFKQVVSFQGIKKILNVQQWNVLEYGGQFGLALITFLYVDILDCTGTLYGMARYAKLIDPVTQDFEGSAIAYMVDAVSISVGALLGLPPVTAFVESGAGISEGGKTGLTAIATGFCFFISIFFAPIFASIPVWATGCVLVLVGCLMTTTVADINWRYLGDAVPAFLCIILMPFSYSIAYGLIAGIFSYIIINSIVWLIQIASRGRIVPKNYRDKEYWTWRVHSGLVPPWLVRLSQGNKTFWREDQPQVVESASQETKLSNDRRPSSDAGQPHANAMAMKG